MHQLHAGTLAHLYKAYFVTHFDTHILLNYRNEVARANVR